ncbi:MAG TPA: acyl--CoA ligase [Candidatus Limadaptatus stercoripullorum]|uniref:Acyl--CoA ligase n=1 Tax=Candidatus Limadaptatus stercoripullorum TaxID=2840846 RepID=A0A9D1N9Z3_9FIRM|nr:acyl--CoA ligase [Candidatus Limadaptatus stercoripullorum]
MPITDFLERNAKEFGDEVCLVEINPELKEKHALTWKDYSLVEVTPYEEHRREMTWREFDEKANRFANLLLSKGLRRGEKVGILLMNCLEWLPVYFGVLKAGGIAVPLNYRYTEGEIKYCLDLADVTVLVFGKEFIGRLESVFGELKKVEGMLFVGEDCPSFAESYELLAAAESAEKPAVSYDDEDYAAIYFSSGTTGFPKAILHRHKALMRAAITEQKHHSQTREDVFLCIPPLYHTGAKMHWFGSLVSGSRAVLLKGVSPRWILGAVSDEKVSIVWLLVPWAQDILDAIDSGEIKLSDYDLSHWRLMHIGAQPVPPSLIQRWMKVFPAHQYDTNYGLSESIGPGCVHLGVENIRKVGAIGVAGYGWQTRIVDDKRRDVPRGEVGELAVKGDGVMVCYYKDEKATRAVLGDGWLYTGDMAREDEEGFIYLVDRKKDVIITGGENLYPVQIEDYIRSCDYVRDVAVIGLPDERLGEIAAAIVELKPECTSVTEEDIAAFCGGLPRYKRPRRIIFDKVPRNATGKIEKPKLREKYCGAEPLVEVQVTR